MLFLHDQSLLGRFSLRSDPSFKIELNGGSTKCGRVMANYFAEKCNKMFQGKKVLEVGAGTGKHFVFHNP